MIPRDFGSRAVILPEMPIIPRSEFSDRFVAITRFLIKLEGRDLARIVWEARPITLVHVI